METAIKLPTQEFLLERFSTPEQAHLAYVDAAKAAHGNFFRSNA